MWISSRSKLSERKGSHGSTMELFLPTDVSAEPETPSEAEVVACGIVSLLTWVREQSMPMDDLLDCKDGFTEAGNRRERSVEYMFGSSSNEVLSY